MSASVADQVCACSRGVLNSERVVALLPGWRMHCEGHRVSGPVVRPVPAALLALRIALAIASVPVSLGHELVTDTVLSRSLLRRANRSASGVAFVERAEGTDVAFGEADQQRLVALGTLHTLTVASRGRKSFTPRPEVPRRVNGWCGWVSARITSRSGAALEITGGQGTEYRSAARRAFFPSFSITQRDAICRLRLSARYGVTGLRCRRASSSGRNSRAVCWAAAVAADCSVRS